MGKLKCKILIIFSISVLFLFINTCYGEETASISFTDAELEYINLNQIVFVAGNKNLFPIEYYSKDEKKFCGIIPDYLDHISKMSGITFKYINGEKTEDNLVLGNNSQVEIITSFERTPNDSLNSKYIFSNTIIQIPGKDTEICFAYTSIASPALISIVQKCISLVSAQEREEIFLNNSLNYFSKDISYKNTIFILFILCLFLIVVSFLIVIKSRKQKSHFISYIGRDELTGCDNMKKFKDNFNHNLSVNSRINYFIASLSIDIETVVEVYGFENSTQLIKNISEIIASNIEKNEFFAVSESAYFVILLKSSSESILKGRLDKIISEIIENASTHKNAYNITPFIGVCQLTQQSDRLEEPMYKAIQARKYAASINSQIYFFNNSMEKQILEESQLEKDILNGLLNNEFVVYLQPYFNLHDKSLHGCEALVRWNHKKRGLLKPNLFIPILEKKNLIEKLDMLMFENVCEILKNRKLQGKELFWISCNFSKQNFLNPNFVKNLFKIAASHEISPKYLLIEITEGLEISNAKQNNMIISQLNNYGFPLVIDNFGSGHSSFIDLSQFTINFVKLDRNLIKDISSEKVSSIASGLLSIMKNLNIKVICNGIESKEQAELLRDLNFDYAQGHFFYYPIYSEEFEKLYDQGKLTANL